MGLCFLFQAEDGILDADVTGVQTCALPISALVKDGGTLQLGIGSLGDTVAHWLRLRHVEPESFAAALRALDLERHALVEREGGRGRFETGLFASSEMFTWGLMTLYRAGVIRR